MASLNDWLEGARVRTLPAAVSPVIIGASIAYAEGGFSWVRTLLAAFVALALQIGVNFSNDYSDGVRGTDDLRQGPPRLTGGGKASAKLVLVMAFVFFGLACVAGLILVVLSGQWWLLIAGAVAVVAAWFYTGGKNPYGYMGLGEVFVFIFFGYMATVGTVYTQIDSAPWRSWVAATAVGLIACALLMVNNIRDISTDALAGKRTLALRMGDTAARWTFVGMLIVPLLLSIAFVFGGWPWTALVYLTTPLAVLTSRHVLAGAKGRELIVALKWTGLYELAFAVTLGLGFLIG